MGGITVLSNSSKTESQTRLTNKAKQITERELETYKARTKKSQAGNQRAWDSMPIGVASSFQFFDPHPVMVDRAAGSRVWDVDGNEYIDFNMGYGALFSGHSHPIMAEAMIEQISRGTLFVTPCENNALVAEALKERFGMELVRFTNSGTEATHDAIRACRAFTGRDRIVKVEGGYHGHHDEVMVSMKVSLDMAGPAHSPYSVPMTKGIPSSLLAEVSVVPYNDPAALEAVLAKGYLQAVRQLTRKYGTMLIFDEVKTGITAGWGGATGHFGVQPDMICLAKSIGGGVPIGAFGGRADIMAQITNGSVLHLGTFNGNPLVSAAALAVLRDILTKDEQARINAMNAEMTSQLGDIIREFDIPAHTVQLGAKGCITYRRAVVKNYRDYKESDFAIAYANWIYGINRGVLLPPGLDEQWLISALHTQDDLNHHVRVYREFAEELRAA
jgi:glutamate-1-semialdehyde 2,1-aminomutase